MKPALEGDVKVDVEDLKSALADFIPPSYPTAIERQNIVAVLECTSRNSRQTLVRLTTRRFEDMAPVRKTRCLNFLQNQEVPHGITHLCKDWGHQRRIA